MQDAVQALLMVLTIGAAIATLRRLAAMDGATTPASARRQHAALFGGLVLSLALPGAAGHAALAGGVLLYLAHSATRWAHVPPWDAHQLGGRQRPPPTTTD